MPSHNFDIGSFDNHPSRLDPVLDDTAYPCLTDREIEEASVFGNACSFLEGEALFTVGDYPFSSYLILSGRVRIVDSSSGERKVFKRYGAGHFTGDIDLLTRRPSVVSCEADTVVDAIRLQPADLRTLFVRKPELGDVFWKSFQKRREVLLHSHFSGLSVYGNKGDVATLEILELLYRNSVPHRWVDTSQEEHLSELLVLGQSIKSFPVITHGNDILYQRPTKAALARYVGLRRRLARQIYDVVIVGAGPAGLGAAVNASSEGLSTLVLDGLGPGGQAGASSRIENYAGFPSGIAGQELAHLSYLQALKFGAEFLVPTTASALERHVDGSYLVRNVEGDRINGKTIIIATGVRYRILELPRIEALQGKGVYYSATGVEALLCKGEPVHVVGAGNSAGQAAMFLSQVASKVTLVMRGDDLQKSMSSYLAQRLLANDRIQIRSRTRIKQIDGKGGVEAVYLEDHTGHSMREESRGLFIFMGARPRTEFLPDAIQRDEGGFLVTGVDLVARMFWDEVRCPHSLETSMPGVFASGDCRSGTKKRVASAVGDGGLAITYVHEYLETFGQPKKSIAL